MAKEWSSMSTRYKALRVTNPRGQQSSTYFLQLPYRYSIPLLMVGILLHWILSGCIYLLVMEGDYYSSEYSDPMGSDGPIGSSIALGFSTKSLLTMMTLSITLIFVPPVFGGIVLPPNSIVVGSNSFAIAAACQVSPLVGGNTEDRESHHEFTADRQGDEVGLHHIMAPYSSLLGRGDEASEACTDGEERKATLLRVSQSKIKWGVVKMPTSWQQQFNGQNAPVEHMSFGLPEDDVQQPLVGHWYA